MFVGIVALLCGQREGCGNLSNVGVIQRNMMLSKQEPSRDNRECSKALQVIQTTHTGQQWYVVKSWGRWGPTS